MIPSRSASMFLRTSSKSARKRITPSLSDVWTSLIDWNRKHKSKKKMNSELMPQLLLLIYTFLIEIYFFFTIMVNSTTIFPSFFGRISCKTNWFPTTTHSTEPIKLPFILNFTQKMIMIVAGLPRFLHKYTNHLICSHSIYGFWR